MNWDLGLKRTVSRLIPKSIRNKKNYQWLLSLLQPLEWLNNQFEIYADNIIAESLVSSQTIVLEYYLNEKLGSQMNGVDDKITIITKDNSDALVTYTSEQNNSGLDNSENLFTATSGLNTGIRCNPEYKDRIYFYDNEELYHTRGSFSLYAEFKATSDGYLFGNGAPNNSSGDNFFFYIYDGYLRFDYYDAGSSSNQGHILAPINYGERYVVEKYMDEISEGEYRIAIYLNGELENTGFRPLVQEFGTVWNVGYREEFGDAIPIAPIFGEPQSTIGYADVTVYRMVIDGIVYPIDYSSYDNYDEWDKTYSSSLGFYGKLSTNYSNSDVDAYIQNMWTTNNVDITTNGLLLYSRPAISQGAFGDMGSLDDSINANYSVQLINIKEQYENNPGTGLNSLLRIINVTGTSSSSDTSEVCIDWDNGDIVVKQSYPNADNGNTQSITFPISSDMINIELISGDIYVNESYIDSFEKGSWGNATDKLLNQYFQITGISGWNSSLQDFQGACVSQLKISSDSQEHTWNFNELSGSIASSTVVSTDSASPLTMPVYGDDDPTYPAWQTIDLSTIDEPDNPLVPYNYPSIYYDVEEQGTIGVDFYVSIPEDQENNDAFRAEVKRIVDKYRLAGKTYSIIPPK